MMTDIPKPRFMFRKGTIVKGFFRPYMSFSDYTEAEILKGLDEITPVTVRVSAMLGDGGTADTVRNIKSLSVKFHGKEEACDMICYSLPVFLVDRPELFPELKEAFSGRYDFDGINSRRFWQLVTEHPEAVNGALRLFSYNGVANSYIDIIYYSVNTYVWENQKGEKYLVRYKWKPVPAETPFSLHEERENRDMDHVSAEFLAGFDPDVALEQLERYMVEGRFPSYELQVQMADYKYISHPNYLKRTLCWNESVNPTVAVGVMKLTQLPEEDRQEQDMISFAPGNLMKGIDLCDDESSGFIDHLYKLAAAERGGKL